MYKLQNLLRRIEQNRRKISVSIPVSTRHSKAKYLSSRVLKFSVYLSVLNAFTQFIKLSDELLFFFIFSEFLSPGCGVIYLLNAIALKHGGDSTVHIYTQHNETEYSEQNIHNNQNI